ncbi:FadR/GntR family transcriptional regulator [Limoniibacter endophyticus]|uniref:GntR family transcriptional regulator n=1 Tax=Limoniibacter endophyticus TaxID=1565040 RepID=A0A8J3DR38_9HYPH|nr:FCD domain-containing protein [Limoniibacter endophyticus]GHC78991.1 GntR family transcriptional regulator [Limoniibacter endophyticus]
MSVDTDTAAVSSQFTVDEGRAAYTQLIAYMGQNDLGDQTRLPPERELVDILGVTRGALRKALALAESEGRIWRHVGKGTFIGSKPTILENPKSDFIRQMSPIEVIRARLTLEPALAREAALNASKADLEELSLCARRCREAKTWRKYENWDNQLHIAVAGATQNRLLVILFDHLNTVRRTVVWGRTRDDSSGPPPAHHSFNEHDAIVAAIHERDPLTAEAAMRTHIESVSGKLLRHG